MQESIKKNTYLEHQMLGQRVVCPIDPSNQRIMLKIDGFKNVDETNQDLVAKVEMMHSSVEFLITKWLQNNPVFKLGVVHKLC